MNRPKTRRLVLIGAIVLIGYGVYFFYFGPKSAGDQLIDGLLNGDSAAAASAVCSNKDIIGPSRSGLSSFLSGVEVTGIADENFEPFANQLTFFMQEKWADGGGDLPSDFIILTVAARGPAYFCVREVLMNGIDVSANL